MRCWTGEEMSRLRQLFIQNWIENSINWATQLEDSSRTQLHPHEDQGQLQFSLPKNVFSSCMKSAAHTLCFVHSLQFHARCQKQNFDGWEERERRMGAKLHNQFHVMPFESRFMCEPSRRCASIKGRIYVGILDFVNSASAWVTRLLSFCFYCAACFPR